MVNNVCDFGQVFGVILKSWWRRCSLPLCMHIMHASLQSAAFCAMESAYGSLIGLIQAPSVALCPMLNLNVMHETLKAILFRHEWVVSRLMSVTWMWVMNIRRLDACDYHLIIKVEHVQHCCQASSGIPVLLKSKSHASISASTSVKNCSGF